MSSSCPFVATYRIATCFSTGSGWYWGCLTISESFSPRVSWSRVALSRSDANCANAARARYWAQVQLERPRDLLHRLGLGRGANPGDGDADVQGGPLAGIEQIRLQEDLAVGDGDDVGGDVGRDVAGLCLDDRERGQGPAPVVVVEARRALQEAAVQVEDVARIGLAARWAAEQEGHLAVRPGVLGEVVVDAQGILHEALPGDLHAVLHDLFAHRDARVRGKVLERGGILGAGDDHDRVGHRPVPLQDRHRGGDRGELLADRDVDADQALALLVDDRVDGEGGLAGLAVTDDQLALAAADRDQRVDGLDAGLDGRIDRLAGDDAGGDPLGRPDLRGRDGPLVVEGAPKRVHNAPEQRRADGNLHDPARGLDDVAFLDRGRVAQDHGAHRLLGPVQGHAHDAAGELQELGRQCALQAIDRGDAVTDLDDRPDVACLRGRIEVVDIGLDDADDLVRSDGHWVLRSGAGSASSSDEAVAEARKPSPHAGIDESVADADGQAPDQLGVDRRLDPDARAGHGRDALGDGREIGGFEGLGAVDVRDDDAVLPVH